MNGLLIRMIKPAIDVCRSGNVRVQVQTFPDDFIFFYNPVADGLQNGRKCSSGFISKGTCAQN